jgi:branched-chain amino acid transport system ATP-binding protein
MNGQTMLLELNGVTKRFGGLIAVNNVTFSVEEGPILSVIGPNGAGKSTLFKLITSFERPTSGCILFHGEDITGLPSHVVARKGIVRTFQENAAFREMTVLEAVVLAHHQRCRASLPGMILRSPRSREEESKFTEDAATILDMLGMRSVANERAGNLAHGHLRGLGIAVALAAEPKVLLLDEPFAGLNPEETRRGMDQVRMLQQMGITVVLVEHDMSAVMAISDRVVVLNFGTLIADGPPREIQRNEGVIQAYLGAEDEELGL